MGMAPRHPPTPLQDPSSCSFFRSGVLTQWVCVFQWHLQLFAHIDLRSNELVGSPFPVKAPKGPRPLVLSAICPLHPSQGLALSGFS